MDYPIYDIELIFVELPKFKKQLSELENIIDKWLFFLNNARGMKDIPTEMDNIPEMKKAFYIANQANLTLEELDDQEKSEFFIQDQRGAITGAVSKALKQGLQEGLQEGLREGTQQGLREGTQQGLREGTQQGMQQQKIEIAKKMLGLMMDNRTICEVTGLSLVELESVKNSLVG